MSVSQLAIWAVIGGLALMLIGGLVLWAYGARQPAPLAPITGVESESTQLFHSRLTRWFFIYGAMAMTIGLAMLLWSGSVLFKD